jgi:hypothetical protein
MGGKKGTKMFWKRKQCEEKLPWPKGIPKLAGWHMVVEENRNPDWVWKLKGVVRPAKKKKAFYCRVFDEVQTTQAGVKVKDWTSLDDYPDLILWEGYFGKETDTARPEKFVKRATIRISNSGLIPKGEDRMQIIEGGEGRCSGVKSQ